MNQFFATSLVFLLFFGIIGNVYALQNTVLTDKGTIKVALETDPESVKKKNEVKLKIAFINKQTGKVQEHIDYKVEIKNGDSSVFGPIPLTHTSIGTVSIPFRFTEDGTYDLFVYVEGVLFQPLPEETAKFTIPVGEKSQESSNQSEIPSWIKNNAGWWAQGQIDDNAFVQGIQYLITKGILQIPKSDTSSQSTSTEIPQWVKNNAGWWSEGKIGDSDFVSGLQYLISNGILSV